jgi:hypothetical protein
MPSAEIRSLAQRDETQQPPNFETLSAQVEKNSAELETARTEYLAAHAYITGNRGILSPKAIKKFQAVEQSEESLEEACRLIATNFDERFKNASRAQLELLEASLPYWEAEVDPRELKTAEKDHILFKMADKEFVDPSNPTYTELQNEMAADEYAFPILLNEAKVRRQKRERDVTYLATASVYQNGGDINEFPEDIQTELRRRVETEHEPIEDIIREKAAIVTEQRETYGKMANIINARERITYLHRVLREN